MKILIDRIDNEPVIKIIENELKRDFDYIDLINSLYNGEEVELEIQNFDASEEEKINSLFAEIKSKVIKKEVEDKL